MAPRGRSFDDEDTLHGEGDGEYCEVCKQEYLGHCPIRSSRCPFEGGRDSDDEEDDASSAQEEDDR